MAERKAKKSPRQQHDPLGPTHLRAQDGGPLKPLNRSLTPTEVHSMGVVSARQFNPEQGELPGMTGPGVAREPVRPLRQWEDLSPEERHDTEHHLKTTYGITMRNAIHNHGVLIDKSVMSGRSEAHQGFYAGGGGVGRDEITEAARAHGLPPHVVAGMRASLSPRSNVHDEMLNLHHVVNYARQNPGHTGPVPGTIGLNGARNSANAVAILRAHEQGIHPMDAPHPTNPKRTVLDPREAPKIVSYAQGYTHPDEARTAVDTHAVGGMAPHLPKSAPKVGTGKYDRRGQEFKTPVPQSHPDWTPNQEDALNRSGTYEFFDHAQRMAALKRGLAPTEGQSMAWHVERGSTNIQPGTGNAAVRSGVPRQQKLKLG